MPKNAYFWKKAVKSPTPVDLRRLEAPPPNPHVVTPAYCTDLLSVFVAINVCNCFFENIAKVTKN